MHVAQSNLVNQTLDSDSRNLSSTIPSSTIVLDAYMHTYTLHAFPVRRASRAFPLLQIQLYLCSLHGGKLGAQSIRLRDLRDPNSSLGFGFCGTVSSSVAKLYVHCLDTHCEQQL